jgi:hypothetical protein
MKLIIQTSVFVLVVAVLNAKEIPLLSSVPNPVPQVVVAVPDDAVAAQPKILRISATVDGSGRMIFTRSGVKYEHKHWRRPTDVRFDGEPWTNLDLTPPPWADFGNRLDLTKATIVRRQGRDCISLENTPDGFDLYLCDSPNGASHYEITIAIPRRQ